MQANMINDSLAKFSTMQDIAVPKEDIVSKTEAKDRIEEQKQMFYKLLIAELKNQLPDNPRDSAQISGQVISIQKAEQLLAIREGNDKLVEATLKSTLQHKMNTAMNHIGKSVFHKGNLLNLRTEDIPKPLRNRDGTPVIKNGKQVMKKVQIKKTLGAFSIPYPAKDESKKIKKAVLTIFNNNNVIYVNDKIPSEPGTHYFSWDGVQRDESTKGKNWGIAPDGNYRFKIMLEDEEGKISFAESYTMSEVTAVKHKENEEILEAGGMEINLDDVLRVTTSRENLLANEEMNKSATVLAVNHNSLSEKAKAEFDKRKIYNEEQEEKAWTAFRGEKSESRSRSANASSEAQTEAASPTSTDNTVQKDRAAETGKTESTEKSENVENTEDAKVNNDNTPQPTPPETNNNTKVEYHGSLFENDNEIPKAIFNPQTITKIANNPELLKQLENKISE